MIASIQGWLSPTRAPPRSGRRTPPVSMNTSRHSGQVPLRLPTETLEVPIPCDEVSPYPPSSPKSTRPMTLVPGIE